MTEWRRRAAMRHRLADLVVGVVAAVAVAGCASEPISSSATVVEVTSPPGSSTTTPTSSTASTTDDPFVRNPPDREPAPTSSIPATTTTPTTTAATTTTTTTIATTATSVASTTTTPGGDAATDTTLPPGVGPAPERVGPTWEVRPASDLPAPPIPAGWSVGELGRSHDDRPIEMWSRVPDAVARRVVVVGGIHGNEPVSPPIVRSLVDVELPDDLGVWLIPVLNPDGVSAGTRDNAAAVDLNRNFPWRWWPTDGGPAPLSEPETSSVAALIESIRPDVVVWVHQPLGYVSSIGTTPDRYEQAWSAASGVPVRPDVTQHGGGESWTNLMASYPSMLIEADGWDATAEMVAAHRAGFIALLDVL